MSRLPVVVIVVFVVLSTLAPASMAPTNSSRYTFYRNMGESSFRRAGLGDGRRVYGGEPTPLKAYPATCALLDRYWSVRCSGAVVKPQWALTAAHCVTPQAAYIKYNSRRPSSQDGDIAPVLYLYRHPGFKVQREEDEEGVDVAVLHHDIGLVRTRTAMKLASQLAADPLRALRLYNPVDLKSEEVRVLGFGRTDTSPLGEELYGVRLRAVYCERGAWFHCVCGVDAGRGVGRGVCSGDSGGPVLYQGVQVGVTSMGPVECGVARGGAPPPPGATSVFTILYPYADLLASTINETDVSLKMRRLQSRANTAATQFSYPCGRNIFLFFCLLFVC